MEEVQGTKARETRADRPRPITDLAGRRIWEAEEKVVERDEQLRHMNKPVERDRRIRQKVGTEQKELFPPKRLGHLTSARNGPERLTQRS